MSKKIPGENQRFKHIAPTLMASAAIFGVSGALAGFTAIVHDDDNYHICEVIDFSQDGDGLHVTLASTEECHLSFAEPDATGNTLRFIVDGKLKAGCHLSHAKLTSDGSLSIKADNACFIQQAPATDSSSGNCFIDDNATPNDFSDDKAFALNVTYDSNDVCDDEPDINRRARSVTAANVVVNADVEFKTRAQGTISIFPPFTVASNHIFRANTNPTS